jgi:hypothetical protein
MVHFMRNQIESRVCGRAAAMGEEEGWARITGLKELKGEVRPPLRLRCSAPRSRCGAASARVLSRVGSRRAAQASVSTRKGNRKVAVYDLTVTLSWEGFDAASDTSAKGELKVSEFASANDEDEFVCTCTVEGKGATHEALRKRAAQMRPDVVATLLAIASEMLAQ